jgi:hypothetical protein
MLGILANDTDNAVPFDNLALVTDRFNTRPDFHFRSLLQKQRFSKIRHSEKASKAKIPFKRIFANTSIP